MASKSRLSAEKGQSDSSLDMDLTQEYTTGQPPTPSTGLTLFTRYHGRRRLAVVGTRGMDTVLSPHIGRNSIALMKAYNSSASPQVMGMGATIVSAGGTTATAVTVSGASLFASTQRFRVSSTAVMGTAGSVRNSSLPYVLSTISNAGGFDAIYRFGIAAATTTSRLFVGMSGTNAALSATVNPSTFLNMFGVGNDTGETTLSFMTNDASGTATKTSLGSSFPSNTSGVDFYELGLFSPSGGGLLVDWYVRRLNDGALAQGTVTTDLPAVSTMLTPHFNLANGTVAVTASLDVASLYVETDN